MTEKTCPTDKQKQGGEMMFKNNVNESMKFRKIKEIGQGLKKKKNIVSWELWQRSKPWTCHRQKHFPFLPYISVEIATIYWCKWHIKKSCEIFFLWLFSKLILTKKHDMKQQDITHKVICKLQCSCLKLYL